MDSLFDMDFGTAGISDSLLSDDVWSKFELDLEGPSLYSCLDSLLCDSRCSKCLIYHDCMWTGHCGSKEHNTDETRSSASSSSVYICPPGDFKQSPAVHPKPQVQQSLLKPSLKVVNPSSVVPMMPTFTPQTPPMSDDEEKEKESPPLITQTMKILHDAIFENVISENSDLSDYFKDEDFSFLDEELEDEEDEDEEEEDDEEEDDSEDDSQEEMESEMSAPQHQEIKVERNDEQMMRLVYAAESDHSYHKANVCSSLRSTNFGIETPSDSEEEIDVVSLGDKYSTGALPTNPSSKDRHQLQRTMQSRFPQGIKTIMPQKRSGSAAAPSQRLAKSAPKSTRSPRHHHAKQPKAQYKKRYVYGHSSDSEPESSEKRSLHNNMERQRRIDLRNLFEDLKVLVPEVNKKQRAAKVQILRGAAQYCRTLTSTSQAMSRQAQDLRKQQERLRARVSHLRRNLASKR